MSPVALASSAAPLVTGLACACSAYLALSCDAADVRALALRILRSARPLSRRITAGLHALARALHLDRSQERSISLVEVSEMIDVVRLCLMAGLSFDAALELYCSQSSGALGPLLARAELSWRVGAATREAALLEAARASGIQALDSFAMAVSQALAVGAPLADSLAVQSREIRDAHRSSVEREIERTPVKLLIPTGTLILPALLLSILGPLLAASGMV